MGGRTSGWKIIEVVNLRLRLAEKGGTEARFLPSHCHMLIILFAEKNGPVAMVWASRLEFEKVAASPQQDPKISVSDDKEDDDGSNCICQF